MCERRARTCLAGKPDCPAHRLARFSRNPTKQQHTAHKQALEVVVTYPFHPRHGESVLVTGPICYRGQSQYRVCQADLSHCYLPVWMTERAAAAIQLRSEVRIPLATLGELRKIVDVALSLLSSPTAEETSNATTAHKATKPVRPNTDGVCTLAAGAGTETHRAASQPVNERSKTDATGSKR